MSRKGLEGWSRRTDGSPREPGAIGARCALDCVCLVALNLAVFVAYRVFFLFWFGRGDVLRYLPGVILRGLRLDAGLLGLELLVLGVPMLLTRHLRCRMFVQGLWAFTYLNSVVVILNFLFFRERGGQMWEMLLANLDRTSQIVVAVEPFAIGHPGLGLLWIALTSMFVMAARAHADAHARHTLDLWRRPSALFSFAAVLAVCYGVNFKRVVIKPGAAGTRYEFTESRHFTQLPGYVLNQAVINPLADFVRFYVPSMLSRRVYQLEPEEAFRLTRRLLDLAPAVPRYPLLRNLSGDSALGLRNVVLIQLEGLGTSVLEHSAGGVPLMPYLRTLAREGLYFPNLYQSFGATDGSVFAAATGLPRSPVVGEAKAYFFPYEYNGHYACLPSILDGGAYKHFFFAGFRQRNAEFSTFASNQGYRVFGYEELLRRLGERAKTESNALGVFDHALLAEAAKVIAAAPERFTVHVMSATSHSPWESPPWFGTQGLAPNLATFRYVDDSVHSFVERLRATRGDFDQTLFVFTGDHTSLTFGDSLSERLRVPLILYATPLARHRDRWRARVGRRGSHEDILPTILSLLDGEHRYAGMGQSLLADAPPRGIISNGHHDGFYITDRYALRYAPHDQTAQLFAVEDGEILPGDVAAESPGVAAELKREYLALSETADRLSREKRVLPAAPEPAAAGR